MDGVLGDFLKSLSGSGAISGVGSNIDWSIALTSTGFDIISDGSLRFNSIVLAIGQTGASLDTELYIQTSSDNAIVLNVR